MLKKYIDIPLLAYLATFYTIVVVLVQSKKSYYKIMGSSTYGPLSWGQIFNYGVFIDWVVVIAFMAFIGVLTKIMFEKWGAQHWKKIIAVHLFFSFFIGYVIFFITAIISLLVGKATFADAVQYMSFAHFVAVMEVNFLVYFAMTGIISVYYYIKKMRNMEIQKAQVETHMAKANLTALQAQLHPHFMFNTLNAISALIDIDKEKSQNLIADFGDLFRDMLAFKEESVISLEKELEFFDKYISILSVRFSDHLVVQKEIEMGVEKIQVPNMLLQPIVENALKHGYGFHNLTLHVKLAIKRINGYLSIAIENDGEPLAHSLEDLLKMGTGICNTMQRLETIYGNDFEFNLNNKSNGGVRAIIKIPAAT